MSHSICFPPRKVTAVYTPQKLPPKKYVPQITTTNKNNKNTTDLRFQKTLSSSSASLFWCAVLARVFFL